MAYFAEVKNGIVQTVIVADQSWINTLPNPSEWIETDPDAHDGIGLRANYAGIGFIYNQTSNVFYEPQPYPSWILNQTTWQWEAPVPQPAYNGLIYIWNEPTVNWIIGPQQWNAVPVILGEQNLQGGGSITFYPPSYPTPNITQWMWREKGSSTINTFVNTNNSITITIPTTETIEIGCINNGVEVWSGDVVVSPL